MQINEGDYSPSYMKGESKMGRFGKKNHVNLDPLSYNFMLLGTPKVGKTTVIKEFCEELSGEDGYMFFEFGHERGADAIEGINHVNIPMWDEDSTGLFGEDLEKERERMEENNEAFFSEVIEDIIENKSTEYPDLKVVVWDTYDHLITIAEEEAVRLWNRDCRKNGHPEKCTNSINGAWGGFGKGEKKAMELMTDVMARMRKVGIATIVIGHVKNKDVTDVVTGETYQTLTSDQQQNYFNHIKKNLHFLGLAYIDRTIAKEKTGKKNAVTKKEETVNRVKAEARKIKFRDDSYAVDSGSRFADIVPEIDLDAHELINALKGAIMSEQKKSGKSVEEVEAEQKARVEAEAKRVAKAEEANREKKELDSIKKEIIDFFITNKTNVAIIKPVLDKYKELGYANPNEISSLEDAKTILAMTLQ